MTLDFNSRSFSRGVYIIPTKKANGQSLQPPTASKNILAENSSTFKGETWRNFTVHHRGEPLKRFVHRSGKEQLHFLSKLPTHAIHMARHCSPGVTKSFSSHHGLICPFASFNNFWRYARMLGTGICRGSCIQTSKSLATTSP